MSNKMPALFLGHGSPMNAIEENVYSQNWARIAKQIKKPKAILAISAHWYTSGTRIMDTASPKMVHDMYGFPDALYQVVYPAKGSPETARFAMDLITHPVQIDNTWGIDHGTWSVLCHMYPEADIPVVQLSIDANAGASDHYRIGQELAPLREKGVLILGSGNVVHNLSRLNWNMDDGYSWAIQFDHSIKDKIAEGRHEYVIHYDMNEKIISKLAVPTPEHYDPLLYILGASGKEDTLTIFNDSCLMGSLSMTSYLFE